MTKIGVMQGSLREFDLADVLQVVGLGRQYTGVELSLGGGRMGTIFVKSGQVVSASANQHEGREAFRDLFRTTEADFFVFRAETPSDLPDPIGPLSTLLMDAVTERTATGLPKPTAFGTSEVVTNPGVAPPSAASAPMPAARAASRRSLTPLPPQQAAPAAFGSRPPAFAAAIPGDSRVLAFASPKGGSGKSTVALNTALSLARRGHSVILVDGDVNGDVLSAIDARGRAKCGALDVVSGSARVDDALLDTVLPRFKLMPSVGPRLPDLDAVTLDPNGGWLALFAELAPRADIVVVDTPAGMFGLTRSI
ncbi:MAG TPA: DUF4388 domain-containing protein, partial [Polyangiaceae bacterium]|nr:DUF4388 domain-containing protein [Polyangiaceae bacterium]